MNPFFVGFLRKCAQENLTFAETDQLLTKACFDMAPVTQFLQDHAGAIGGGFGGAALGGLGGYAMSGKENKGWGTGLGALAGGALGGLGGHYGWDQASVKIPGALPNDNAPLPGALHSRAQADVSRLNPADISAAHGQDAGIKNRLTGAQAQWMTPESIALHDAINANHNQINAFDTIRQEAAVKSQEHAKLINSMRDSGDGILAGGMGSSFNKEAPPSLDALGEFRRNLLPGK